MDRSDIKQLLAELDSEARVKGSNSREIADKYRTVLEAAYELNDFPVLSGLEEAWKFLESQYEVVDRNDPPSQSPLEDFTYYIEGGFYPPPEVLLSVNQAIQTYFTLSGDISLDEAFFGQKHNKWKSSAYLKTATFRYFMFHKLFVQFSKPDDSLEDIAEAYLADELFGGTTPSEAFGHAEDVESFLRGYRRWKEKRKEDKQ